MENREAETLLRRLLTGVDPFTGETFGKDHVCMEREVREALQLAVRALAEAPAAHEHKGESWSEEDDAQLRALFDSGCTRKGMCEKLGRSDGAIRARLKHLGLDLDARKERIGGEWSAEDREALKRCQTAGLTIAQTAAWFGRTEKEITAAQRAAEPQVLSDPYGLDDPGENAGDGWFFSEE